MWTHLPLHAFRPLISQALRGSFMVQHISKKTCKFSGTLALNNSNKCKLSMLPAHRNLLHYHSIWGRGSILHTRLPQHWIRDSNCWPWRRRHDRPTAQKPKRCRNCPTVRIMCWSAVADKTRFPDDITGCSERVLTPRRRYGAFRAVWTCHRYASVTSTTRLLLHQRDAVVWNW